MVSEVLAESVPITAFLVLVAASGRRLCRGSGIRVLVIVIFRNQIHIFSNKISKLGFERLGSFLDIEIFRAA